MTSKVRSRSPQCDVTLVTADLMGDPTPEQRRRQAEAAPLIEAHELYTRKYQSAYAAGYRARKGKPDLSFS